MLGRAATQLVPPRPQCRSVLRVICASADGFIASPGACYLPSWRSGCAGLMVIGVALIAKFP
jgi:hypothetical protein